MKPPRISSVLSTVFAAMALTCAAAPSPPNVLFILADDMGWGDARCYNADSKIATPNIDRLASQGMRFIDAHTPSSVCTPTRYGLLTGRYCWRTRLKQGVLQGYDQLLIEPGRLTVAGFLKQRGYNTAAIGKWHLGLGAETNADYAKPLRPGPGRIGFDYFFGIAASLDMPPYVFIENDAATAPPTNRIADSEMRRKGGGGFWRAGAIAPGFRHEDVLPVCTQKAIEFLRKQSTNAPFFLYLPLTGPHTPWMPTPEFQKKSDAGWYGDFVQQVDHSVGRILRTLDEAQLAERTLVVFTSDNGGHWLPSDIEQFGHRSNAHWRGQKADWWEGGHRVPFMVRWPGRVKPGATSDALICLTDFFATIAEALGAKLPADAAEDSVSFLPVLLGQSAGARGSIVHHSGDGGFAVREGSWKLCLGLGSQGFSAPKNPAPQPNGPKGQLYDLAADPGEKRNLWSQEPARVAQLTALLEKLKSDGRTRRP